MHIFKKTSKLNLVDKLNQFYNDLQSKASEQGRSYVTVDQSNANQFIINFHGYNNTAQETAVRLEKCIVNLPSLTIRDALMVDCIDCIFTCPLFIIGSSIESNQQDPYTHIMFDNCIFEKEVKVLNITAAAHSLRIINSRFNALSILGCTYHYMDLSFCMVARFGMLNISLQSLLLFENHIILFSCQECDCSSTDIDINQFDLRYLYEFGNKRSIKVIENTDNPKTIENIHSAMYDTATFLRERSNVRKNREKHDYLKYIINYYSQRNNIVKALLATARNLADPLYIFAYWFLFYLIFAGLYTCPFMKFDFNNLICHGLSLANSLYFSAITCLTIGYGDITPLGLSKLAVSLQGFIGVATINLLIVSFVKKYID